VSRDRVSPWRAGQHQEAFISLRQQHTAGDAPSSVSVALLPAARTRRTYRKSKMSQHDDRVINKPMVDGCELTVQEAADCQSNVM